MKSIRCLLRRHVWKEFLGFDTGMNTIAYGLTKRCLRCNKKIILEHGEVEYNE